MMQVACTPWQATWMDSAPRVPTPLCPPRVVLERTLALKVFVACHAVKGVELLFLQVSLGA